MPGPQFTAPRPAVPSAPRRRFTLAQANKALPLVRRIVDDIVRTHELVSKLQDELEGKSAAAEHRRVQGDLEREVEHLQGYVEELAEVGCELKDFQTGLVDFVGRHKGRDVYLCWKMGEPAIEYWHEMQAGFAGRQPVSMLEEGE